MQNKFFYFLLSLSVSFLFSCNGNDLGPDYASEVAGLYTMTYYETQTGVSSVDLSDNEIEISRLENDVITIVINYASPLIQDVVNGGVVLNKEGDKILFARSYNNAQVTGFVLEDEITYDILYTNGDFAKVRGER